MDGPLGLDYVAAGPLGTHREEKGSLRKGNLPIQNEKIEIRSKHAVWIIWDIESKLLKHAKSIEAV